MSNTNTPLEQNSIDLNAILTAVNNLPEYVDVPPTVDLNWFSVYDAEQIAEWIDTINLSNDTDFDSLAYTDGGSAITVRSADTVSDDRSVVVDMTNYMYVASLEFAFKPAYSNAQSTSCMVSKGVVSLAYLYQHLSPTVVTQATGDSVYKDQNGVQKSINNSYGIYLATTSFASYADGRLYTIIPQIVLRAIATIASASSLSDIDSANSNIYVRRRIYRMPKAMCLNNMYDMAKTLSSTGRLED